MTKMNDTNLAQEVGKLAGHGEDEIARTTAVTNLDIEARKMYGDLGNSTASCVHRLFWRQAALHEFGAGDNEADSAVEQIFQDTLAGLQKVKSEGKLYNERGKVSDEAIAAMGKAGFWGLRVPKEFGGAGASDVDVMRVITRLAAAGFHNEAGLQSVHGCIGAVDPIRTKGTPAQKEKYLPLLAAGKRDGSSLPFISSFALTELGAGSDLSNIKTVARRIGPYYLITGEKRFITNSRHGGLNCLVALVEDENGVREEKPAVFIVELPETDTGNFKLVRYGLHPLKKLENNGLRFMDFPVPAANRITRPGENGMVVAYHGLNYGRIAVDANAAGGIRQVLRSITGSPAVQKQLAQAEGNPESSTDWGKFRKTYGRAIEQRDLVKERIARLAQLIVACDALREWSASKLEAGFRGELECTIAKVFGSWALAESAVHEGLTTHGGRSLVEGHLIGDNLFDFLAPLIYEGENHMLLMKFFLELAEEHGEKFMLPLGQGINELKSFKPSGFWKLVRHGVPYAFWNLRSLLRLVAPSETGSGLHPRLARHVKFAFRRAAWQTVKLNFYMLKHQTKLGDRQPRVVELAKDALNLSLILVTALHADKLGDEGSIRAADALCQELTREIKGGRKSDSYFRDCNKLADLIIAGQFMQLSDTIATPVVWAYNANNEPVGATAQG